MRRCFRSVCSGGSRRHPCIVYFSLHGRPGGGGNYLVACQRAAVIAVCVSRMAAVNMAARACVAVGGQVLMLIKCVSLNHLCVPLQTLPVHVKLCVCPEDTHTFMLGQAGSKVRRWTGSVGGGGLLYSKDAFQAESLSLCPDCQRLCPCVHLFVFPNYPLETTAID